MDNMDTEIIEATVTDVETAFINEDNAAQQIPDEIITGEINDMEGQADGLEEMAQMEQTGVQPGDDIIIAEAVVVTQYSCKFCNRRFDTIDKVKNHYLQRHDKNAAGGDRVPMSTSPVNNSFELPNIKPDPAEQPEEDLSSVASPKKAKMEPRTNKKSPARSTTANFNLRVVGSIKSEDPYSKSRKRGRKPSGVERRFPCDWPGCNYIARHSVHLKDHKRTHTGEKPYRCNWPDCGLGFVQGSALKTHLRTHTGEKPYPCEWPGCTLRFSQKNNVKIHMRTHTGEKPYACDWPGCEWRFAIKGNLDDHKRVHAGEKFFVCDWPGCNRSYTQNSHLRRHQLVHMEDKPFACDWPGCNYRSVRSCDVANHKVTHTGEKKFVCDYPSCGKGFSRSHHLKRHTAIHQSSA